MKKTTLSLLTLCLGLTQVSQASIVNVGSTGRTYDTQRTLADSIIGSTTTTTSSHYTNRGKHFNPTGVANFSESILYWEHDKQMNPDVTMTFSGNNVINNGAGNDGLIFVAQPSSIWGRTMGVDINGTTKEIFADILVGKSQQGWNVYAGLFDLSDFGVSAGSSVNSMTILSSLFSSSTNFNSYSNGQLALSNQYGNYSDVIFYGGGTLNPVPIPTTFILFSTALVFLLNGRKRTIKSL